MRTVRRTAALVAALTIAAGCGTAALPASGCGGPCPEETTTTKASTTTTNPQCPPEDEPCTPNTNANTTTTTTTTTPTTSAPGTTTTAPGTTTTAPATTTSVPAGTTTTAPAATTTTAASTTTTAATTTTAPTPTTAPPGASTTLPPTFSFAGATTVCVVEVPTIRITFGNALPQLAGQVGILTMASLDGTFVSTQELVYAPGTTVSLLYPGTRVNADGSIADVPGWNLNAAGFWVPDPTDAFLRDGIVLTYTVNPTATAVVTYPPESSACANPDGPFPPAPAPSPTAPPARPGLPVTR